MRNFCSLSVVLSLAFVFTSVAQAGQHMSAHACQPYQIGGALPIQGYYQNQGSILASSDTSFTCPIPLPTAPQNVQVRLYYATRGVTTAQPIWCRIWKMSTTGFTAVPSEVYGYPNLNAGTLDLLNTIPLNNGLAAHLECRLKAGAKILGYFIYQ